MPRRDRLDTFDTAGHVQRRERDQLFQIVEQRGRDELGRHMMRTAVDDSMPDGVEARQLQALELVEQRIDGGLRARELRDQIRPECGRRRRGSMILPSREPIRSAAPSAMTDSAPPETEYSANLHDDEPTLMQRMV